MIPSRIATLSLLLAACTGQIASGGDPGATAGAGAPAGGGAEPGGSTASATPGGGPAPTSNGPAMAGAPGVAQLVKCDAKGDTPAPRRIWRLKATQYENTIAVLLGGRQTAARRKLTPPTGFDAPFDGSNTADRFTTTAASYSMNQSDFRQAIESGKDAAGRLVAALKKEPGNCLATGTPAFADCMKTLIAAKAEILFRRPITPDESTEYVGIATSTQPQLGNDDAATTAFHAMLMSPYFLFRTELGQGPSDATGALRLGPYEVAAALSYSLADAPPDDDLWKAAAAGALSTPEQIRPHVERLAGGLADQDTVVCFFREYLRYDQAATVAKDPKDYPFHKPDLLTNDTELWLEDILTGQGRGGLLKAVLTSPNGFVRAATAQNYGVTGAAAQPARATLPAGQRAGILTQPSFLSAYSTANENQPVQRGRFIAERLLCQTIPQIMIPPFKDIGPNATLRERILAHSADPGCAACHRLMDPLGLGLEAYDDVGRYRTMFAGRPIDSAGELYGTVNGDGTFKTPIELAQRLAASPVVDQCFTRHAFRYWLGRDDQPGDACTVVAANAAFDKNGGDYVELLASLFTSKAFLLRSAQ